MLYVSVGLGGGGIQFTCVCETILISYFTITMVFEVPLEDAMGKLIVYMRAVPYKRSEVSGDCCEMYSFNDGAAQDAITGHPRGVI